LMQLTNNQELLWRQKCMRMKNGCIFNGKSEFNFQNGFSPLPLPLTSTGCSRRMSCCCWYFEEINK
jgi:hypothetical protein